jgi:hypothetical protein
LIESVAKIRAGDVLHHHPCLPFRIAADVVQGNEVRMLEVQALRDAAELDIQIPLDAFEGHFLSRVADGEVDFAESSDPDTSPDRVTR